jgi:hypothetical protein
LKPQALFASQYCIQEDCTSVLFLDYCLSWEFFSQSNLRILYIM